MWIWLLKPEHDLWRLWGKRRGLESQHEWPLFFCHTGFRFSFWWKTLIHCQLSHRCVFWTSPSVLSGKIYTLTLCSQIPLSSVCGCQGLKPLFLSLRSGHPSFLNRKQIDFRILFPFAINPSNFLKFPIQIVSERHLDPFLFVTVQFCVLHLSCRRTLLPSLVFKIQVQISWYTFDFCAENGDRKMNTAMYSWNNTAVYWQGAK